MRSWPQPYVSLADNCEWFPHFRHNRYHCLSHYTKVHLSDHWKLDYSHLIDLIHHQIIHTPYHGFLLLACFFLFFFVIHWLFLHNLQYFVICAISWAGWTRPACIKIACNMHLLGIAHENIYIYIPLGAFIARSQGCCFTANEL